MNERHTVSECRHSLLSSSVDATAKLLLKSLHVLVHAGIFMDVCTSSNKD